MQFKLLKDIESAILEILSRSPVPEDYDHARNVLEWVNYFNKNASVALQIAALAHDIERAVPEKKVLRKNFASYDAFKWAHAQNSARIARDVLIAFPISRQLIQKVEYLIRYHEFGHGDDPELIILKDADSLSFFEKNLPHYYQREGKQETWFRMQWGFNRLSQRGKDILGGFHYDDRWLNDKLKRLLS